MKMKKIITHSLTDFIPTSILDVTQSHYLKVWELSRLVNDEVATTDLFSSKSVALTKLQNKWEKLNTSSHVTNLTPINVNGDYYGFAYEFDGIDKELSVTSTTVKIG